MHKFQKTFIVLGAIALLIAAYLSYIATIKQPSNVINSTVKPNPINDSIVEPTPEKDPIVTYSNSTLGVSFDYNSDRYSVKEISDAKIMLMGTDHLSDESFMELSNTNTVNANLPVKCTSIEDPNGQLIPENYPKNGCVNEIQNIMIGNRKAIRFTITYGHEGFREYVQLTGTPHLEFISDFYTRNTDFNEILASVKLDK